MSVQLDLLQLPPPIQWKPTGTLTAYFLEWTRRTLRVFHRGIPERQETPNEITEREALAQLPAGFMPLLDLAVAMAIEEMRGLGFEERARCASECVDVLVVDADPMMSLDPRRSKGSAGRGFVAVAKGLAALAFQPGGVTWLGQHWEAAQ